VAKKASLDFSTSISAIVGPNGSGKSNLADAMRFVLGEQSIKSMRGKKGEDLIFNGTQTVRPLNFAKVTMVFDNADRSFRIDFDEVSISREVYRDGTQQYFINNSQVRLKDVYELLSAVHIGASGHHIISQGESDRILNSSLKERKEMIEDALGLKMYHWRIEESEKKLEKTQENLKEIEMVRREVVPHLNFLKKQVEKIEKAEALRLELVEKYKQYLKREDVYLQCTQKRIANERAVLKEKVETLDGEIRRIEELIAASQNSDVRLDTIRAREQDLYTLRNKRSEITHQIGKLEGMIEFEKRRLERVKKQNEYVAPAVPDTTTLYAKMDEVESFVVQLEQLAVFQEGISYEDLRGSLDRIRESVSSFRTRHTKTADKVYEQPRQQEEYNEEMLLDLQKQLEVLRGVVQDVMTEEEKVSQNIRETQSDIEKDRGEVRNAERNLYEVRADRSRCAVQLESLNSEDERYSQEMSDFEEEIRNGVSLIGAQIKEFYTFELSEEEIMSEPRNNQQNRRREIDRAKMRIEDLGGAGGADVLKEYNEVTERNEFLLKEIADLTASAASLKELIVELKQKLEVEFKEGIDKINKQFQEFFVLMFGGGDASLSIVDDIKRKKKVEEDDGESGEIDEVAMAVEEEEEKAAETGIDISVSLPRKKIRGLQMLSGGERALTSIALLFAMSQVNPPPFMILDETDAALDEANSRKYGDMLENLSKYSQLVVITHNRETMSRAGILYGVTMDADATSKLLSIRFEEAERIAK
jgi:chromosome segregation protein